MAYIARPDDLRRQNRRRVLSALRHGGPKSRTELTAITGLSHSTVTLITAALMDEGSVVEVETAGSSIRRGRPQQALALNPQAASVATVTLTLNRLSAAIIDYAGNAGPEKIVRLSTQNASMAALRGSISCLLEEAMAAGKATRGPLRHIAVAVQGMTDAAGTELMWSPVTRLRHVPIAQWMSDDFDIPSSVANDCNMIAEALRWAEPQSYGDNFAAILLSHGIGMGMYLQGRPFTGIFSSAAEFGHMCFDPQGAACRCGRRGCIEAYGGDYAIWRHAMGEPNSVVPAFDILPQQMAEIAGRARTAPGLEREAYRKAGEAIGAGLRSLFALLDPFPVAFVGSGALAFDLIEPGLRDAIGASTTGTGEPEWPVACYPDEFPLIRDGAFNNALQRIDDQVSGLDDAETGRMADAV